MKNYIKANSIGDYIGAVFLMTIFFGGIVAFFNLTQKDDPQAQPILIKQPECLGTYDEYQELVDKGQSVQLVFNQRSYAVNQNFVGLKTVVTRREGEVACGYLFVEAHKRQGVLNNNFDSIYINPQGLGGHLLRPRNILQPTSEQSTEILYKLKTIPYLSTIPYNPNSQDFKIADWVKLINASRNTEFLIGLSTTDTTGVIDEVRIAYRCWNSSTGEETADCQLSVER